MRERAELDPRARSRARERAALTYDAHAELQREIASRLLDHLDPIRIAPRQLIDLGCATGVSLAPLGKRFPAAQVVGIDLAHGLLARAGQRVPSWRRLLGLAQPRLVCASAEALPIASSSADLMLSNLTLQSFEPERVFAEAARVLRPGALFLFSTLGPDTLKELRAALSESGAGATHVHTFIDMHDLGDALVHAGFASPVMEMELVRLEYRSVEALVRELRDTGEVNARADRPRGLFGRGRWSRMVERYESSGAGAIAATFEVIYGHAWRAPAARSADGRQVIDFRPRSRS